MNLFAGPWIGEFGWELFAWQGYLRKIAKDYDHVTVCSRPDKKFLYEDFADDFIAFTPSTENVTMWANYGVNETAVNKLAPPMGTFWLDPRKFLSKYFKDHKDRKDLTTLQKFTPSDQEFISYGNVSKEDCYDIVIHARNRTDEKAWPEKNYPKDEWEILVEHFLIQSDHPRKIACVGHKQASLHIPGTEDLRGFPLERVADILASSKLCIGCSDGLLNFAALCKTPRLIWTIQSEADKNIDRHYKIWNPFEVPVQMIVYPTWRPPVEQIICAIEEYFEQ